MRRIGIYHFNRDPKRGVDWLMSHGILRDEARDVAGFFHSEVPWQSLVFVAKYVALYSPCKKNTSLL